MSITLRRTAIPRPVPGNPDGGAATVADLVRVMPLPPRYDLAATVSGLAFGGEDPTTRATASGWWRAVRTPEGPATLRLRRVGADLEAAAWGNGAAWVIGRADAVAGLRDPLAVRPDEFTELLRGHPTLARLAAASPTPLLPRTDRVFQALVPVVLAQRVTYVEAVRGWRRLAHHVGEPAPGPVGLLLPPDPRAVAATPYWVFHPWGVEARRAETVRRVAAVAPRLEEAVGMSPADATRRLTAVPGVGPWTAAEVSLVALGDADAVSVGDHNLPHQVAWTLAGRPRGDDALMLELLAPFAGHRARVVKLVVAAGSRPPGMAPRRPARNFARW